MCGADEWKWVGKSVDDKLQCEKINWIQVGVLRRGMCGVVCVYESFLLPSYCHICGISIIIKNGKNIAFHEIPVFNIPHIFAIVFNHVTGRYIIDIKFYSFLFDVYNAVVALSWFWFFILFFICAFRSYSFEPHTHQTKLNRNEPNELLSSMHFR